MSNFQLYKKAISATGTTIENEPIIKSDGASSNVMQWLSNDESSNITISEDGSNNLDLDVSAGTVTAAALDGTLGATTPATVAATTGAFSGDVSITNTAVSAMLTLNPTTATYSIIQMYGAGTAANGLNITAGNANAYYGAGVHNIRSDLGANYGVFSTTGLAVTGAISASGVVEINALSDSSQFKISGTSSAGNSIGMQLSGADGYVNMTGANSLHIRVGSGFTDVSRFSSTGLAVTGTVSPSGGIQFPATQAASADANNLDDYEEGTFTGVLTCGTSGTITVYSTFDTLSYTKVGRMVTITGKIFTQAISSPLGTVSLTLPFTSAASSNYEFAAVGALFLNGNSATASPNSLALDLSQTASSVVGLVEITTTGIDATSVAGYIDASTWVHVNMTYFV